MKNLFLIFILLFTLDLNAQDTLRLKVMTYNLRFGELATIDQLAEHIKAFHPDFVALEEVDVNTQRSLAPHPERQRHAFRIGGKNQYVRSLRENHSFQ